MAGKRIKAPSPLVVGERAQARVKREAAAAAMSDKAPAGKSGGGRKADKSD